ncbi:MAG: NAD(P)-binding domain-containing protein, partial [Armatimonadota bacterium]|nr:NAD(P)-binding domain-containing protein [Armatimonadota bacterium]
MSRHREVLQEKIVSRTAEVAVIGLGYVGLALAVELGDAGYRVTGFDLSPERVDAIRRGESYVPDVKASDLVPLVEAGLL